MNRLPMPTSAQAASPQVKPPETPPAPVAQEFVVTLRASGECWLEVVSDGQREEVTLAAGGEKEIRARERIEMKLGDVSVVEVAFNGEALPPFTGDASVEHVLEIARQSVPDGYGNSYFWVN